jgi:hypothetical protein
MHELQSKFQRLSLWEDINPLDNKERILGFGGLEKGNYGKAEI